MKETVLLLLLAAAGSVQAEECCPGSRWERSTNCTDGTHIRLVCEHGMYQLDPVANSNDEYKIVDGILETFDFSIAQFRFCTTLGRNSTTEIALVCFEPAPGTHWRNYVYAILSVVSIMFLLITLSLYILIPELRDLQGKVLMGSMTSLICAYTLLAIEKIPGATPSDDVCAWFAFVKYFFLMATFSWLNLVSFNVWRSVRFATSMVKERLMYAIYSCIGWGGPIVCLVALLIAHHTDIGLVKPQFGVTACWFNEPYETWVWFEGPIAGLLGLNIIYFSLTCYELWLKYVSFTGSRLRVLRFKCWLYLKLILIMGITWIFEVLSFAAGDWTYWIVTDIMNSLQGLVIFLLLVVTRKRVRKLLATKQPLGIRFPRQWAAVEDEECEQVLDDDVLSEEEGFACLFSRYGSRYRSSGAGSFDQYFPP